MRQLDNGEREICQLALGRILRIASRPFQQGDIEEYERCRKIAMDTVGDARKSYRPNYVRDRMRGAQGD